MKLIDFILGREPVATATGVAAVVTAGLGVAAAFGADITAEQIAAIGTMAAAVAGWAARRVVTPVLTPAERELERMKVGPDPGSVPLALLILIGLFVLVLFGLLGTCDALFEDEDEPNDLGQVELVSHDYDDGGGDYNGDQDYDQWRNEDENRNRNRNRGSFSPGPFDDSPVTITICAVPDSCPQNPPKEETPT